MTRAARRRASRRDRPTRCQACRFRMLTRTKSRVRHGCTSSTVDRVPTKDLTVETRAGSRMPAVLAWPDDGAGPWPVAVVLGELFGLTDVQRDAAERVAGLGHVAIAPHLLHRR